MASMKNDIASMNEIIEQARANGGDIGQSLYTMGYRLDPYLNGKSKVELISRIESLEAERDKTRNLLRAEHDKSILLCFPGLGPEEKRKNHSKLFQDCPVCTFFAETSTVKP